MSRMLKRRGDRVRDKTWSLLTETAQPSGGADTLAWINDNGAYQVPLIQVSRFFPPPAYFRNKNNIFTFALTRNVSYCDFWDNESSVEKLVSSAKILSSVLDEE